MTHAEGQKYVRIQKMVRLALLLWLVSHLHMRFRSPWTFNLPDFVPNVPEEINGYYAGGTDAGGAVGPNYGIAFAPTDRRARVNRQWIRFNRYDQPIHLKAATPLCFHWLLELRVQRS